MKYTVALVLWARTAWCPLTATVKASHNNIPLVATGWEGPLHLVKQAEVMFDKPQNHCRLQSPPKVRLAPKQAVALPTARSTSPHAHPYVPGQGGACPRNCISDSSKCQMHSSRLLVPSLRAMHRCSHYTERAQCVADGVTMCPP